VHIAGEILNSGSKKFVLWEALCAFGLLLFYGQFTIRFAIHFFHTHSISTLLLLIYELIIMVMIVIRNLPKEVSWSFYHWIIAIGGTLVTLCYIPPPDPHNQLAFIVLQLAGIIISMAGLVSLYTSYGTVPANRGIRTTGLYAIIRHPLYCGYFISNLSFIAQNFTIYNVSIFGVFLILQILRIGAEEKFLLQDPDYKTYCEKTRWRLIPFLW
jgi:steroid 5-alpha reductase family enzyme